MTLISLCIPVMNRTHDLRRTMPHLIAAANASPPVEIAILDYNSSDGLGEFVKATWLEAELRAGNELTYNCYTGRDYYHLAHAYNLAVKASRGEYVAVMGADAVLADGYVAEARRFIAQGCVWARSRHYKGIIVIERETFIEAGGYDERLEFYSGEDKELEERLLRRGLKPCIMPDGLVSVIKTPNDAKLANYRLDLTKLEMMQNGRAIREENAERGLLVANEGQEWGAW